MSEQTSTVEIKDINHIKTDNRKRNKKILIPVIVFAVFLLSVIGFFIYRDQFLAVTMRIQRLVGTVNLYNEGREQELKEKMRLGAGQTVETSGDSLIMVSLDDTKLLTMEETSKADIKARGKKLEFDLIEGNLFFNVTKKLKKREAFNIHTSTMLCGIRGTSAYVGKDSTKHETLMVTDGVVSVDATNPVTKEKIHTDVYAGEKITIFLDEEAEGNATISIRKEKFREEDLPSLALDAIRKNPELQKRIAKATGFKPERLIALADATSRAGISMYGSAADQLHANGIRDAIPIMGYNAHIMVRTANRAADTAGKDLPLEIAIIKGLNGTMRAGMDAGYRNEPLDRMVLAASECTDKCISEARNAGLTGEDLVTVADSVTSALQSSVSDMARANLSTSEITQVVKAIETVYTEAIASGVSAGAGDNGNGSSSAGVLAEIKPGVILSAVSEATEHIRNTVDNEMTKKSNGEVTATELLRKETTPEQGTVAETTPAEPVPATRTAGTVPAMETPSTGTQSAAAGVQPLLPTAGAASVPDSTGSSSSSGSGSSSSSGSGGSSSSGSGSTESTASNTSSGTGSTGNTTPAGTGNPGASTGTNTAGGTPAVVYGNMTIAGGITGGVVTTPLAAGTGPATGDTVILDVTPDRGHSLQTLTVNTVDGSGNVTGTVATVAVTAGRQYTFVMPADKTVVGATFAPNTYNVNLNLNGATVTTGNITQYTYGTAVALPTQVTKDPDNFYTYAFTGWTDAPTGGNAVTGISATDIDDKNFYPRFSATARTYSISLSPNSGNALPGGNTIYYTAGTGTTLPAGPTKDPTDEYIYPFAGWFTEASGGTQVTAVSAQDYGDKIYYAHWGMTTRYYSVVKNVGSNGTATVKVGTSEVTEAAKGATVTVDVAPATGYELDTLTYTPEGGSAVPITASNGVYSFRMPAKNITVSATFKARVYGVTLNTHGGIINGQGLTGYTYGVGATLPANVGKQGSRFDGWFATESDPTDVAVTAIPADATGDKIYHARWTQMNTDHTLTIDTAITHGTVITDQQSNTYGVGENVYLYVYPEIGYKLKELYYMAEGSSTKVNISNYTFAMPDSNATVYASFEIAQYTITYDLNAGGDTSAQINGASPVTTYVYGTEVVLPASAQRTGYTFDGWYTRANGGVKTTRVRSTDTGNKTFYAHWTRVETPVSHNISLGTFTGGVVTSNTPTAQKGDTVTLTVTPSTNYELVSVTVRDNTGRPLGVVPGSNPGTRVFTMPESDVTVDATFCETAQYTVAIASNLRNGTVTAEKPKYNAGETVLLTLIPEANCVLSGAPVVTDTGHNPVTPVTDVSVGQVIKYQFTMPADDVTVDASFVYQYRLSSAYSQVGGTVSLKNAAGETISSAGSGDVVTLLIKPNTGYTYSLNTDVSIRYTDQDGDPWDLNANPVPNNIPDANGVFHYTFTMPYYDTSVSVAFHSESDIESPVTLDPATQHGTITFSKTQAKAGEIISMTATPDPGYALLRIIVKDANGSYIDVSGQNTFGMPVGQVTVKGEFVPTYLITKRYDSRYIEGMNLYDMQTYEELDGDRAKAGDTVIVEVSLQDNANVTFDGVNVTDAAGTAVNAQFVNSYQRSRFSPSGPMITYTYYTYKFIMPASSVTVEAGTTARPIEITSIKVYYSDGSSSPAEVYSGTAYTGTYGSASLDRMSGESGDTLTLSTTAADGYYCSMWSLTGGSDYGTVTSDAMGITLNAGYGYSQELSVLFMPRAATEYDVDVAGTFTGFVWTDKERAAAGDTVIVSIQSPEGWYCESIYLKDENGDILADIPTDNILNGTVSFSMPECDVVLYPNFEEMKAVTRGINNRAGTVAINGDSTSDAVYAIEGDRITILASANTGYTVGAARINYSELRQTGINGKTGEPEYSFVPVSQNITLTNGAGSFTMPASDTVVEVEFETTSTTLYNINIDSGIINGTVTSDAVNDESLPGRTVTLTAIPDASYRIKTFEVKDASGVDLDMSSEETNTGTEYRFYMPDSDVTVTAVFERYFSITYEKNNISFSYPLPDTAMIGETVSFTVQDYSTIDNGNYKKLDSLEYSYDNNGVTETQALVKDANGHYSFTMPASDVTVTAHPASTTYYEVGASAETGQGTWTTSASMVGSGGSIVYTITPAVGYELDKVEYGAVMYSFNPLTYQTTYYDPIKNTGSTTNNPDGTYSFTFYMSSNYYQYGGISGIQKRPKVWIYFVKESYDINIPTTITGGTVTASPTRAEYGDTVTLTVTPETAHTLKNISVQTASGSNVALSYSSGNYTFTMPASAVNVSAEFVETSNVGTAGADPSTWFADKNVVRISSNVDTNSAIEVASGRTLIIDPGVTVSAHGGVTIASGGVINNYGTFNTYSNMTNNGTFNNYSGNTLNNYGTIINNGTLMNGDGGSHDGRLNNFDGAVIENNGTIINNEGSVVNNDGEIEGNKIVGKGEVNDEDEKAETVSNNAAEKNNTEAVSGNAAARNNTEAVSSNTAARNNTETVSGNSTGRSTETETVSDNKAARQESSGSEDGSTGADKDEPDTATGDDTIHVK
jgi:uncharacterized repeat protein (TIGR02543 family)